jgi:hypothetical protein
MWFDNADVNEHAAADGGDKQQVRGGLSRSHWRGKTLRSILVLHPITPLIYPADEPKQWTPKFDMMKRVTSASQYDSSLKLLITLDLTILKSKRRLDNSLVSIRRNFEVVERIFTC